MSRSKVSPRDVRHPLPRPSESRVPIEHQADVFAAQHLARRIAAATGFPSKACSELMIVASELASNVLKYGRRGSLRVEPVDEPDHGVGVRLVAEDEGPHFKSFETALLDGWSDDGQLDPSALIARRGTASGLGAVRRMTHELRWEPLTVGKAVIATRYLAPDLRAGRRRPVAR